MTTVLQIVKPSDTSVILYDLNDPTAVYSGEYGGVRTDLMANPNFGPPRWDFDRFEAPGITGGTTTFQRAGLKEMTLGVVIRPASGVAASYDNLASAVGRLADLLSNGCVMKWVPDGSAQTRYIDVEPSPSPVLLDGRELGLWDARVHGQVTEGITLALTVQPFLRGDVPATNILSNPTMLRDSDDNGTPNSWANSGFSPLELSDLKGWWDFSDAASMFTDAGTTPVASDGDLIYRINDKSGTGEHLVQTTSGSRPVYKVAIQNSRSVGRCASSKFISKTFVAALTQPNIVYAVIDPTANTTLWGGNGGAGRHEVFNTGGVTWDLFAGATATGPAGNSVDSFTIYVHQFNTTASYGYKNGGTASTPATAGTNTMDAFNLSSRNGTNFGNIDCCEVLVYNALHTVDDVNTVGQYLANKWGLTWSVVS